MSRILKSGKTQVTQTYAEHVAKVKLDPKKTQGVDIVKEKNSLDWICCHTDGTVIKTVDYLDGTNGIIDREGLGYGNYVMVQHKNNIVTLYAHLEKVQVKVGQAVQAGQTLGFMGATGSAFGAHVHFEVRSYSKIDKTKLHDRTLFKWINSQAYVDIDLPEQHTPAKKTLTRTSYPNVPVGREYRVRKSFDDGASSKGSFCTWEYAFNAWNANKTTHHVYDYKGNQLD